MPPQILIPKESHKAILDFARMSDADFQNLMQAVEAAPPQMSVARFREKLNETLDDDDVGTWRGIISELVQMEETRSHFSLSADELAEAVGNAALQIEKITKKDVKSLKERVKIFSDSHGESIALTCKTAGIIGDHDRVFYNSRIMTDIRSVFNKSADAVDATVIVHTLVIHFGQGGDHKDIYFAMDAEDIKNLQEALDRAKKKEKTLRSLIQKTSTQHIS